MAGSAARSPFIKLAPARLLRSGALLTDPRVSPPFPPGPPPPPPPTATPPAPPHGRPTDLLELRAAEEAQQQQGRLSRKEGGGADPFPYSDEVPPAKRDWKAEGKITPVKVRPRA